MSRGRTIALVVGGLMVLPGIGLLLGGVGLGNAYASGRDSDGYLEVSPKELESSTAAITAGDLAARADFKMPGWLIDALDTEVRLQVTATDTDRRIFVGIGAAADVGAYMTGVAHDEIIELTDGGTPGYRTSPGGASVPPPTSQTYWTTSSAGTGTQELRWKVTDGRWAAVIMNADGTPGVAAGVVVGVKAGFLLPLALILLGLGAAVTAGAIVLIVVGASGRRADSRDQTPLPDLVGALPAAPVGGVPTAGPVALTARLDPDLSRWQWLVKWFLAIPHFVVLAFLWPVFIVATVIAGFSVLFTGTYPRPLFEFNLGVLRWSWRVSYYATSGGIGTDRYPPFTLGPVPDYPAVLAIDYPPRLSRGLVLVKWWLLAIPHYLIIGLVAGSWWAPGGDGSVGLGSIGGGLIGLLVLVAGIVLLFTGRYPQGLFGLIVGCNRWIYRVIAYAALMTDQYPPFRLDQGGTEPTSPPSVPPTSTEGPVAQRPPEPAGTRV